MARCQAGADDAVVPDMNGDVGRIYYSRRKNRRDSVRSKVPLPHKY